MQLQLHTIQSFQLIAALTGLIFLQTQLSGGTIMNVNGVLFQLVANMTFMFMFAVVDVGHSF